MENRIIKVKGVGQASIPPDMIKINIEIKSLDDTYEKSLKKANYDLENLRTALGEEGFEKESIKTINFSVDTKYENETREFNSKRKFIGYEIHHSLTIEFDNNEEKLSGVLNALARSKANPEFSIVYKLKDSKSFKEMILKDAISNSREKAALIAEASGVKLGEIIVINYSFDEDEVYRSPLSLQKSMSVMSDNISIVAEDLQQTDTVEITWQIEI
nr:SIMPL domain-containing protein [Tissierella sp.]